ncbi:MAG: hypothetical protein AAFN11_19235 [Chloroflexota bacterium]
MSTLTYISMDNNTHELVFNEATRKATDEFIALWAKWQTMQSGNLYIVLDMRPAGMVPLRYLTKQMKKMLAKHVEGENVYIAIVLDDPQMLMVTQVLLRTIVKRQPVQYFTQVEKAHLWIKIEQKKAQARNAR